MNEIAILLKAGGGANKLRRFFFGRIFVQFGWGSD